MKKIIITLVVLGFAFSVNAQQLPILPKQQPLKQFKFQQDSLSRNNPSLKLDSLRKNMLTKLNLPANTNVDNMPIARMQGNSNMPIVQTDRTAYNMPVVGMNQARISTTKKPGNNPEVLPFFEGKPPVYYEFKKYPNGTPPADNSNK